MGYVIGFLGINLAMAVAFVAGWYIGPKVIGPIVQKILAKVASAVQK